MKRREMREHIFKLLFMGEFNTVEEMPEQSSLYFETLEELSPQEEEYMRGKYEKVLEHVEEIDELLNKVSSGWKVNRMSKVDLNILRLAVYEMKYDEDVPFKVFRRGNHIGIVGVADFVMTDLKRQRHPRFTIVGNLDFERTHDVSSWNSLRRCGLPRNNGTRESVPAYSERIFKLRHVIVQ